MTEQDRGFIIALTIRMVEDMIERAQVDSSSEEALKEAALECLPMAKEIYFLVMGFSDAQPC